MPNNSKIPIKGTVIEVCSRTEEGLPLTASPIMKVIGEGILARAQTLFPITICHFVVMANHIHMILVVDYPENLSPFIAYLKREWSQAINRLWGRRKYTNWCEGYDSPVILDFEKAIERVVYCYTNPQKADLEESIDAYPNLDSWNTFLVGGCEKTVPRISRDSIPVLPQAPLSMSVQESISTDLV